MLTTLRTRWRDVLHGLWFRPGAIVLAFGLLATLSLWLDRSVEVPDLLGFGGDASAARSVLSTIATSLMTVAGVSLSLTVVTLQLVAGQVTPRAVRGLLSDPNIHVSIGGLFGIFLYCLLVLRAVRSEGAGDFVPRGSVTGAIILAIVGLGLLLLFVHRVTVAIRVPNIAAEIAGEALASIDRSAPDRYGGRPERADDVLARWRAAGEGERYHPRRPGYVQSVDVDALLEAASGHRLAIVARPGDFVSLTDVLIELWPAARDRSALERSVLGAVNVASERDVEQDPGYGVQQLLDIALRALSSGVNDPTTAVTSLSYVAVILERLAGRATAPETRRDDSGEVVAVVRRRRFEELIDDLVALEPGSDPRVRESIDKALTAARERAREVGAEERVRAIDQVRRRAA